MSRIVTRTWSVRGQDGSVLAVTETPEGGQVDVSIHQKGEPGRVASIKMNEEQFEQLFSIVMGDSAFFTEHRKTDKPPMILDLPEGRGRLTRP